MRLLRVFLFFLPAVLSVFASAQGGPPFIADDPATPGNGRWQINIAGIATHNPGESVYQAPNLDVNYGLGDRIQLRYEVPLALATNEEDTTRAGLGDSLLGIKWRALERHTPGEPKSEENTVFSLGTYPQVVLNNPTSAVRRGIVESGPQYFLPLQFTAKVGPINFNGETGRWFGNHAVPDRWGRGLIAGHRFNERFELYGELYDLRDLNRIGDEARKRSSTVDVGGRQTLNRAGNLRLLFMGGRSVHSVTRDNGEPSWIAYVGVQVLVGRHEQEAPNEKP